MWISHILVFFYTLTWILSFSALRKSWATGSDFQTASLSKFSKKMKIWCGFTLFWSFFSSKQAFYRLPALTQSQATGFDLWKIRAEIERTTTIWDGFFAFWSFPRTPHTGSYSSHIIDSGECWQCYMHCRFSLLGRINFRSSLSSIIMFPFESSTQGWSSNPAVPWAPRRLHSPSLLFGELCWTF